jgi:signal transduction histidine kinase
VQGCFVLATDVSVIRRVEETRRRTERLAALGTMAAGIAHEVSNPAASILAAAEMARTMLDAPDAREALDAVLQKIAAEATRCGRIVQSVLSFADAQATERRAHDLNVVVAQAVDLVGASATSRDVVVRFMPAPDLPAVVANDSELTQVVINLLDNAVHAESTCVTVRTETRPHGVALVVSDDGVGIPSGDVSRVFDPFFTTRSQRGGTGLGLSISHAIVARHGGELHIESTEGRGTTVTATLPVHGDALPAPG